MLNHKDSDDNNLNRKHKELTNQIKAEINTK